MNISPWTNRVYSYVIVEIESSIDVELGVQESSLISFIRFKHTAVLTLISIELMLH